MAIRSCKLEKLTIQIFDDAKRQKLLKTFKAMFNPTSFSLSHKVVFTRDAPHDSTNLKGTYSHSEPRQLSLDFIFDGTGVASGASGPCSISGQLNAFLHDTMDMNGSVHEPNHLRIQWGDGPLQNFDCRMASADVTYSLFDTSGAVLRATVKSSFVENLDAVKATTLENKQSPDLTHARVVRAGDTLPILCKQIYGSSHFYLRVAQANDLDDFRNLVPGSMIRFPPLAK